MVSAVTLPASTSSESPFLHDPGSGPCVKNMKLFLESSFAQPVGEDELCQEFGQVEVFEMLMTLLPEDTALVGRHPLISTI